MKEIKEENGEEEKQLYLREHILNKGYDANEFMDFFKESVGTADLNLNDYTMEEIGKLLSMNNLNKIAVERNLKSPTKEQIVELTNDKVEAK